MDNTNSQEGSREVLPATAQIEVAQLSNAEIAQMAKIEKALMTLMPPGWENLSLARGAARSIAEALVRQDKSGKDGKPVPLITVDWRCDVGGGGFNELVKAWKPYINDWGNWGSGGARITLLTDPLRKIRDAADDAQETPVNLQSGVGDAVREAGRQ